MSRRELSHDAALFQDRDQEECKDASCYGGDQERYNVNKDTGRCKAHQINSHRISSDAAEDSGSQCFRSTGKAQFTGEMVNKTAAECANHTSRESHEASKSQKIAEKACDKGNADPPEGA